LEKIEMKKTLVAVAALAAATGAMAQVTISGFFDQAYNTVRSTDADGASSTVRSVGHNAIGQDSIGFAVSEDLGNGITAFGAVNLIANTTTGLDTVKLDNGSGVGVKGAFGTVGFAQGYSLVWKTSIASDASGWGAGIGNVHGVGAGGVGGNAVYYILPEIMPGLSVSLEAAQGEAANRGGDYNGAQVNYTVGGFMASYAIGNGKALGTAEEAAVEVEYGVSAAVPASTGEWTAIPKLGSTAATTEAVTAGAKSSISALALTYDFGMAKVFGGYNSLQSGGNTNQTANSTTFGVTVPFGAVSVGIAASQASYRDTAGDSVTLTGTRVLAKYAFSKRTNGYIQYGTAKISGGNGSATGNGIGLTHSF